MYAATWGSVIANLVPRLVRVEVDVSRGLPAFDIVGRPAPVVRESRDRVRAAIRNCGLDFPVRRITVNLAPADFPKAQSFLDLPIALGVLAASGQVEPKAIAGCLFVGELSLVGNLEPVQGCLAVALLAAKEGLNLVCPEGNLGELQGVSNLQLAGYARFAPLVGAITAGTLVWHPSPGELSRNHDLLQDPWIANGIVGGARARRCLQVAAAGRHNLALIGPPGVGKSLLAKILHELSPALSTEQSLEVAGLYSAAGLPVADLLEGIQPFRAPHHSLTRAGLIGGGVPVRPGELTLANRGCLFLDELPLFQRAVLEALREPLEAKKVVLGRCAQQITLPADVQLVTAFNLCPCGYYYFRPEQCTCSHRDIVPYLRLVRGPLADRIDIRLAIAKPLWEEPVSRTNLTFAVPIAEARAELAKRESANGEARLPQSAIRFLRSLTRQADLSARSYFKLISLASTISALEASEIITEEHLAQAWQYRSELPGMIGGEASAVV